MRRVLVGWIALVAVLALRSPVHADVRDEAGREFAAGEAADRRGDYERALQHYMRANDLVPHPSTVFNIATNYERLGKLHESLVWFQRYVDEARNAPDREAVLRRIRDLKARIQAEAPPPTGTLRVIGPIGAQVFVDDAPIGTIPQTFDLPPGSHRVRVVHGTSEPYETTVEIYPQRDSIVRASMKGTPGPDPVSSRPKPGYLLGVAGGVDLRDSGPVVLVDLGIHALKYDLATRIGRANGFTALDIVIRVALGSGRIAPYVGGGYSFTFGGEMERSDGTTSSGGGGYALIAGLRMELSRSEHATVALVAESGMRIYGSDGSSDSGVMIPLLAAVQLIYK
jgi:hypothetical protein